MRPCFIVTGTDTGIGKTVFAAALVRALDGIYWKPVQAGLTNNQKNCRAISQPEYNLILRDDVSSGLAVRISNVRPRGRPHFLR